MFVHEEHHGPLMHWEIRRTERLNALGPTLGKEVATKLALLTAQLKTDKTIRMLYVTAAPNTQGVWIAGGDLKELAALPATHDAGRYALLLTNVCQTLADLPIPVVMGLDGRVIGGGLEFALAGDIRLATPVTILDFRQLAIGLATAFGGASRLVKLVGLARALEWQLLCAALPANRAQETGLITQCLPTREALFAQAQSWARHFEALPFASVAAQKTMLLDPGRTARQNAKTFRSLWRNPLHEKVLARFARPRGGGEE